jgi:hypothetical protein
VSRCPNPPAWLPFFLLCMIAGAASAAGARDWRSCAVFAFGVLFFGWPCAARLVPARTSRATAHPKEYRPL